MPRVGFGLYKTPSDEAFEGTRLALAAGVRHFDTAASYGNEEALGEALRASSVSRDEIFVSTKATPREVEAAGGAGKAFRGLAESPRPRSSRVLLSPLASLPES